MRLGFALLVLLVTPRASAQGTGTLAGQVLEADGVTTVIGANVRIEGTTLGAATDIDGNYQILGVPAGIYTVTASYVGYASQTQAAVDVNAGYTRQLNFTMPMPFPLEDYGGCGYESPMITNDVYTYRILVGEDLERMPVNR
ncbi:MAG TPA: carboxypeptidase-like regulatory domain-containing protein [Rubricoccaceae bacterium]|jgi:hypothetical protein